MSVDQVAKLAHQLLLFTNVFLNPVVEREEKTYTCHTTRQIANKAVKKRLTKCSIPIFKRLTSAFLLILYQRPIPQ